MNNASPGQPAGMCQYQYENEKNTRRDTHKVVKYDFPEDITLYYLWRQKDNRILRYFLCHFFFLVLTPDSMEMDRLDLDVCVGGLFENPFNPTE